MDPAEVKGRWDKVLREVKSYLTARFDVGTQTGRKSDPSQVATDMRTTRNA